MTDYALWDAAYGMEASKRYTSIEELRKAAYNKVIKYGQRTKMSSRYEIVSINYGKRWIYTGRADMDAVGNTVYYTAWRSGRPTGKRWIVQPNGKLVSKKRKDPAPFGL